MKTKRTQNGNQARLPVLLLLFLLLVLVIVACSYFVEESSANQVADYLTNIDIALCDKQTTNMTQDIEAEPEPELSPSPIPHNTIASGVFHSLVIVDGSLWAWGSNFNGRLGDGTTEYRFSPVQVGTDTDWASVVVGMSHTVALKTDGSLWAWGRNSSGQLGDGTTENRYSPVQIGTDTDWAGIFAANDFTMAKKTNGTLWGWGSNSQRDLGMGIESEYRVGSNVLRPVQISVYDAWVQMTSPPTPCRWSTRFIIKEDGTLWGWGSNMFGQIGDGTTIDRDTPVQIGTDTDWERVAIGDSRTVAIKTDGSVWSWGWAGRWGRGEYYYCRGAYCTSIGMIGDGTHCEDRHSPVMILEGFSSP